MESKRFTTKTSYPSRAAWDAAIAAATTARGCHCVTRSDWKTAPEWMKQDLIVKLWAEDSLPGLEVCNMVTHTDHENPNGYVTGGGKDARGPDGVPYSWAQGMRSFRFCRCQVRPWSEIDVAWQKAVSGGDWLAPIFHSLRSARNAEQVLQRIAELTPRLPAAWQARWAVYEHRWSTWARTFHVGIYTAPGVSWADDIYPLYEELEREAIPFRPTQPYVRFEPPTKQVDLTGLLNWTPALGS